MSFTVQEARAAFFIVSFDLPRITLARLKFTARLLAKNSEADETPAT